MLLSRLLVPATASSLTVCPPADNSQSATFRCVSTAGKTSTFRAVVVSEALDGDRFRITSHLAVRDLRESVPLASLALPNREEKDSGEAALAADPGSEALLST